MLAVAFIGFLQLADFNSASAQRVSKSGIRATPEMLAYALTHETEDLATRFNIMNQLPCENLEGAALGGKTLGAGVYCLGSANVAGDLTFDASGDTAAVFVVRVSLSRRTSTSWLIRRPSAQEANFAVRSWRTARSASLRAFP